jgi:16S rRNA (adenine1518-N6/adenine1519-N6)-dimethyltransferase
LRRYDIHPGRRLGQHFLYDRAILARIVNEGAPAALGPVLEVGPGVGTLTLALRESGADVTAVEIDRSLRAPLLEVLGQRSAQMQAPGLVDGIPVDEVAPGVRILWADAVRLPWRVLTGLNPGVWSICSNLPYYITGPFLASFLGNGPPWSTAVLLVQSEVAERLMAAPGSKAYGAFTCVVGYHATVSRLWKVPKQAFVPPPAVESVLVRLHRRDAPPSNAPPGPLMQVVRGAFAHRRKTLGNALHLALGCPLDALRSALAACGLAAECRGESLDLARFGEVTEALIDAGLLTPAAPPAGYPQDAP